MIEGCIIDFVVCCFCGREILWKDVKYCFRCVRCL